jgi:hypothetical protein
LPIASDLDAGAIDQRCTPGIDEVVESRPHSRLIDDDWVDVLAS